MADPCPLLSCDLLCARHCAKVQGAKLRFRQTGGKHHQWDTRDLVGLCPHPWCLHGAEHSPVPACELGTTLGTTLGASVCSKHRDRPGAPQVWGEGSRERWPGSTRFPKAPHGLLPPCRPPDPQMAALLYSGSFRLCVFSFLLISCFLDLTMAELLSVSLLKKAGGWLVLPGDLEPILLRG